MPSTMAPVVSVIQSDPKVDSRYLDRISAYASDNHIVDRTITSRRSPTALSVWIDDAIQITLIRESRPAGAMTKERDEAIARRAKIAINRSCDFDFCSTT